MAVGVYPGSFNPPTVAHLAIAEAARDQLGLDRVDLALSLVTLGKHADDLVPVPDRLAVLRRVARSRPRLRAVTTEASLVVDIAAGYDVLVVGEDKWDQIRDPVWYGSVAERDAVLARLPALALAPRRAGDEPPPDLHHLPAGSRILDIHDDHRPVSASGARAGRVEWMLPEAAAYDRTTGVWTAPPAGSTRR